MNRYEEWVLCRVVDDDGIRMGHLLETAPFGRDNVRKAVKALTASGAISRQGVTIFPTPGHRPKPTETGDENRLAPTENGSLVPPHAPPPKDLKPGSNGAREATGFVVVCTWRDQLPGSGLCDFSHQTFFANRQDAFAHYSSHTRQPHAARDWEVVLIHRKSGETIESWSTQPYEPVPYETAKEGLNAFIRNQLDAHRVP